MRAIFHWIQTKEEYIIITIQDRQTGLTYMDLNYLGVTVNANMTVSEQCIIAVCNDIQVLGMIRTNIILYIKKIVLLYLCIKQ